LATYETYQVYEEVNSSSPSFTSLFNATFDDTNALHTGGPSTRCHPQSQIQTPIVIYRPPPTSQSGSAFLKGSSRESRTPRINFLDSSISSKHRTTTTGFFRVLVYTDGDCRRLLTTTNHAPFRTTPGHANASLCHSPAMQSSHHVYGHLRLREFIGRVLLYSNGPRGLQTNLKEFCSYEATG